MNSQHSAFFLILVLLCLQAPPSVSAHSVNLFAIVEGEQIKGQAYLSGGNKIASAVLKVYDATDQEIAETRTASDGTFQLPVPAPGDLTLRLSLPDGHAAQFVLRESASVSEASAQPMTQPKEGSAADLDRQLASMLDRKLAPIHAQLAEIRQQRVTFQNVLTGIGFILGIFGAAALARNRRSKG